MTDPLLRFVQRYGSKGVLVDSNILLLYFVGSFDRKQIPNFKRTAQFIPEDYDLLVRLLAHFTRIVTVPNVLSEVNSLLGQMGEPRRTACFRHFAQGIGTIDEHYVESRQACRVEQFVRLGLTDSAILRLAGGQYLVLTDDLKLAHHLELVGIDVLNFNHIRGVGWT